MAKFSAGNTARVKYVRKFPTQLWRPGAIVTIEKVDIGATDEFGDRYDYVVILDDGKTRAFPIEDQLEVDSASGLTWNIAVKKGQPILM